MPIIRTEHYREQIEKSNVTEGVYPAERQRKWNFLQHSAVSFRVIMEIHRGMLHSLINPDRCSRLV